MILAVGAQIFALSAMPAVLVVFLGPLLAFPLGCEAASRFQSLGALLLERSRTPDAVQGVRLPGTSWTCEVPDCSLLRSRRSLTL